MQTLLRIVGSISGNSHPNFVQNDPIFPIYRHIDFQNAVVGGSYALHQFTGDTAWTPNDVDIVTVAENIAAFQAIVQAFAVNTGGEIIKFNDFSNGHPHDDVGAARRDEKFHESIRASSKIVVPGIDIEIQFVYIHGLGPNRPVEIQLEEITDLPSCVSYKVFNGKKFFLIPEKGREALLTRRVPKADICPSRMEKYQSRLYEFY